MQNSPKRIAGTALVALLMGSGAAFAQPSYAPTNSEPNPYQAWCELWPAARRHASGARPPASTIAPDGTSGRSTAAAPTPASARASTRFSTSTPRASCSSSFGAGLFIFPHGLDRRQGRQRLGDRSGAAADERQGPAGLQVQPGRQGADDARQGGSGRRRPRHVQPARPTSSSRPNGDIFVADGHGRHDQRADREVLQGREVHQGVGQARVRAPASSKGRTRSRSIRAAGCSSATAEQPHSDFRSGRQVPRVVEAVRPAERHLHRQNDIIYVTDSESREDNKPGTTATTPACNAASASAASKTAR